jgi:Polyketide cyclase / dehydrase and lipid transport
VGEYTVTGSVTIASQPTEVLRWLTESGLMTKWMLGADKVEPADDRGPSVGAVSHVTIYAARSWTSYLGEITEIGPSVLARRYRLDHRSLPAAQMTFQQPDYERVVRYDLRPAAAGVEVTCAARTVIPGLPGSIRDGNRASARSLQRSLERLAECAEGRRGSLLRRIGDDSKNTGEPL